jgi:hypothetical protein
MLQQFNSLLSLMTAFPDEQTCVDHLRAIRWKNGAFCPYFGGGKVYHFSDHRTHKCGGCRQRFSIKLGTILADTKRPLQKWYIAVWMVTSHKKGIASIQPAKDQKITQKSAWSVLHRLRYAARTGSFNILLEGEVEADENYVGGKPINKHAHRQTGQRGTARKAIVAGAIERDVKVVARVIPNTDGPTPQSSVRGAVSAKIELLATDERSRSMRSKSSSRRSLSISAKQYADSNVHTQTIDGYWSQLKRQITASIVGF